VEFKGNPEFDGLIIVLGDYTIDGSGTDPFTGAIISSPYSQHFQAQLGDSWVNLNPEYDSETGQFSHFLTSDGQQVYQGPNGEWTTD
ncbi:hypothetical protein SB717_37190, partial [Priestia sp. SIMBA_032]|uniref:hypothetical protein n=1 Tax=Priestia sp. SIMBA_032 TaxID=3085775 RepID=UPI00397D0690